MTVMITLRRKGVNRISKGCVSRAPLKSEPPNTIITPRGHVSVWIFTKIEIGYCKNKLYRIAISTATLMILLGTPESLASRDVPRRAVAARGTPSHFDRSIDDGSNDSTHKNSDFSRDRGPALNDLATC